jgi:hypothetical protein
MIEINLLPEEMRRKKRASFKLNLAIMGKVKFLAGGIALGVLVFLVIFLSMGSSVRKKQIIGLMAEERNIEPLRARVESVDKEVSVLKTKMAVLDEITKRRFLWARKLNEISDIALTGIWFRRIYTDSNLRLIIEGSVISKEEEAMATVGKFMKDMGEHISFFEDFRDIKLETVQKNSMDDRDAVDFTIALYFKNDGGY